MSCPAYRQLRFELQQNPDIKLGFAVDRCTYESDEESHQFMTYLDTVMRTSMESEELDDICNRIDWTVQEGEDLDNVNIDAVCHKFQAWISRDANAEGYRYGGSRHHACIMVKQGHVDEVLKVAAKSTDEQKTSSVPNVRLVSARDGDDGDDYGLFTEVRISRLMPEVYALLEGPGWPGVYGEI